MSSRQCERGAPHIPDAAGGPHRAPRRSATRAFSGRLGGATAQALLLVSLATTVAAQAPDSAHPATSVAPSADSVRKEDVFDLARRIFHIPPDTTKHDESSIAERGNLSLLPSLSASPTVGFKVGATIKLTKRYGDSATTNVSDVSSQVFFTTLKQFGLTAYGSVFTKDNKWNIRGDWRYLNTSQPTYGLGSIVPSDSSTAMKFQYLRLAEALYRNVGSEILLGGGYNFSMYFGIDDQDAKDGRVTPFLAYNGGHTVTQTISSGPTFALLHDSRDNPLNAARGLYAHLEAGASPTWLGSTSTWESFLSDLRYYFRPGGWDRGILALWQMNWLTFGNPPYMELPATAWDRAGRVARGYGEGRIRGASLVYGEAEYRVTLTRNGLWGVVGFASLTSVSSTPRSPLNAPDPAFGAGLRIKLSKRTNTNITLDYALGREGSSGFFFGSAEAF